MKYEKTAERLKMAMDNKGIKAQDLADLAKLNKASISQYINGVHQPSNVKASAMAKVLDVSPVWLMGFDVPMRSIPDAVIKARRIPVLGTIAAGVPLDAVTDIIDYEEIPADWPGEYFSLQIKGDSMLPKMSTGDVVICRAMSDVESGDTAVVRVNGDYATVKQVIKQENGITLVGTNTAVYQPTFYSNKDIAELPVEIVGKVVELRMKF